MAYFELHDTMPDHPKVIRLARLLGKDRVLVIGHLVCLWAWTLRYRPSGDLDGMDEEAIADAARFAGDGPCAFVDALQAVKLIEKDDHGYHVHDWADYTKNYKKAKSDQARIADKRATVARQSQDASATKAVNGAERSGTERNGAEQSLSPSPAAPDPEYDPFEDFDPTPTLQAPPSKPKSRTVHDYPADFSTWWPHYPKNAGKFAAAREWTRLGADRPPLEALVLAADTYAQSKKVREGFVLDAERWLKGRRWLDDPVKRPSAIPGFDPVTYARS